jgi:hypothetical protein
MIVRFEKFALSGLFRNERPAQFAPSQFDQNFSRLAQFTWKRARRSRKKTRGISGAQRHRDCAAVSWRATRSQPAQPVAIAVNPFN